ncbi:DUF2690 domain-containing protein [Micromonospora rosaria]|uniref:DUF2690 domain-containing protein n=1 Tax=Micromonospora rosaria TaxID=47874 RepID=UPI0009FF60AE|nr:DUF2690 domain-containing protein [Micromonospora rosaria]
MSRPRSARLPRVLLAILLAVVGAVTSATVAATPALAAGCYQSSCNGQLPQDKGCDAGATTIASFRYGGSNTFLQGALMELRRSTACDAAWIRTTDGDCLPMWRNCGAVLEVSGGSPQFSDPRPGQRWSAMWSYRNYVRGCFIAYTDDGGYHRDGCTAWK